MARVKKSRTFFAGFRRQYVIGKFIADFYCHKAKLVIELDGSQHAEEEIAKNDKERTAFFEQQGIQEIRFWNDEIRNNLSIVIDYILQIIHERRPTS